MRSRAWCITINNYTFEDMLSLHRDLWYRYLIFGFEVGENGTEHIQGYVYFDEAKTMESLKKKLPRAHLEPAKGTPEQNFDYCKKDDEYYEDGIKPEQGRAQWHKIKEAMANPKDNPHLFNQYRKTYKFIENEKIKKRTDKTVIIAPGSKKYDYDGAFIESDFDTYDGEEIVIRMAYWDSTVEQWYHGFPYKFTRGYEIIHVNPKVYVLLYDNIVEYNYLIKKYSDIVDQVIDAKRIRE